MRVFFSGSSHSWTNTTGSHKNSDKTKIQGFYQSQALQKMRPRKYKYVSKFPYDLYCPFVDVNNEEYVCTHCKKICTIKQLLKLHLGQLNIIHTRAIVVLMMSRNQKNSMMSIFFLMSWMGYA